MSDDLSNWEWDDWLNEGKPPEARADQKWEGAEYYSSVEYTKGAEDHSGEEYHNQENQELERQELELQGHEEQAVPAWWSRLMDTLPEVLFAPYDPRRARFCFRKLGISEDCGMIVFSAPARAREYQATFLEPKGFVDLRQVSLDQACDLAREKNVRVNCVALIDDPFHPVVQIVR